MRFLSYVLSVKGQLRHRSDVTEKDGSDDEEGHEGTGRPIPSQLVIIVRDQRYLTILSSLSASLFLQFD